MMPPDWDHRDGFIHVPKGKSVISQHQTTLGIKLERNSKTKNIIILIPRSPVIVNNNPQQASSLLIPGLTRIHGETTPAGVPSDSRHPDFATPDHLSSYSPSRYRSSSRLSADDSSSGPVGNSINPSSLDAETKSRTAASARSSLSRKLLYHPSLYHQLYILTAVFAFCCAIMVVVSCSLRRGFMALTPSQCSPPRQI